MRYALLFLLSSAVFAQRPANVLAGKQISGLAIVRDAILADTAEGLFWIERHEVRPAPDVEKPDPMGMVVRHAGFEWRATKDGVSRVRTDPAFTRFQLPHSDRVHALAAGADGAIWCGTQHGVAHFQDGVFTSMQRELGLVTAVAVDRSGNVWVGSGSAFTGVYRYDGENWKRMEGIDAYVHSIALDPAGTLWFAALNAPGGNSSQGRGAWYWAGDGFKQADWLGGMRVYDVAARDPSGVLWFATLNGLVAYTGDGKVRRYTPQSGELAAQKVWCLSAASDGSLWVGYQRDRGGASRIAGGTVTHFTSSDGLCSDEVWAVAEGRRGVLWFSTDKGLTRYDGRRWSCFEFTDAGLWPLLAGEDGELWIGTIGDGLWRFRPVDTEAPRTVVTVTGNRVTWTATDAWFDTPAEEIWFRYRAEGGRWSRARRGKQSLTLEPGSHIIEVQAIDGFGNAQDPPVRVAIDVKKERGVSWLWALPFVVFIGWIVLRRGSE